MSGAARVVALRPGRRSEHLRIGSANLGLGVSLDFLVTGPRGRFGLVVAFEVWQVSGDRVIVN